MNATRSRRFRNILFGTVAVFAVIVGVGKLLGPRFESIGLSAHQHGQVKDMPGVVRGSTDPRAIPDEIAYSILFRMLARGDARTPLRYRQNAAYVRFRMGIRGGDCLDDTAYPASPALPPVVFKADHARALPCPIGKRFVTYHERLVRLAQRYVSAIGPAEEQAQAAPLAARRNQPIGATVATSLTLARRAQLGAVLTDLDPVLGKIVATEVRQFVTNEMKKKMSVRAAPGGGMK